MFAGCSREDSDNTFWPVSINYRNCFEFFYINNYMFYIKQIQGVGHMNHPISCLNYLWVGKLLLVIIFQNKSCLPFNSVI